jgi:hypothetical protein
VDHFAPLPQYRGGPLLPPDHVTDFHLDGQSGEFMPMPATLFASKQFL